MDGLLQELGFKMAKRGQQPQGKQRAGNGGNRPSLLVIAAAVAVVAVLLVYFLGSGSEDSSTVENLATARKNGGRKIDAPKLLKKYKNNKWDHGRNVRKPKRDRNTWQEGMEDMFSARLGTSQILEAVEIYAKAVEYEPSVCFEMEFKHIPGFRCTELLTINCAFLVLLVEYMIDSLVCGLREHTAAATTIYSNNNDIHVFRVNMSPYLKAPNAPVADSSGVNTPCPKAR